MHARTHGRHIVARRNHSRGITLLELGFALALVALLAGLAAPGFRASLRSAAVRSASFDILAGLHRIRAVSILQARVGVFCPAKAEATIAEGAGPCLPPTAGGSSWLAFLEQDAGRLELAGEPLPRGVELRATRSPLRFWPHAHAASTGTLTICDTQAIAAPRAIVISQSGRARLAPAPAEACAP